MAHLGQEDQDRQNAIHRMVKMISDGENRKNCWKTQRPR